MATQVSLNDGAVASAGALAIQTNGTTQAVSISTGQVATLAQNPILTSGTANGVAYLNGSKVLTTGSALVFDGTNLGVGVTPSAWGSIFKVFQTSGNVAFSGRTDAQQLNASVNWYYDGGTNAYIANGYASRYIQESGIHQWYTAPSGTAGNTITFTQAMTLDASGNLSIGATSTTGRLLAAGAGFNILGNAYGVASFIQDTTTARGVFLGYDSTGQIGTVSASSNGAASNLAFWTYSGSAWGERARIDSSGNLLVGTTGISTGSFKGLQVGVNAGGFGNYLTQNPAGTSTRQWNFGMNSSDQYVVYGYNNTTFNTGAYIAWGGTSWTAQSDERKKDIIEPIADAMTKVSTLRAVIGKYKTDVEGTRRSFLIAQDVQAVLPEAVDASNPDDLGVQYTETIPLLVAAIKEQSAHSTKLQADVAALKGA